MRARGLTVNDFRNKGFTFPSIFLDDEIGNVQGLDFSKLGLTGSILTLLFYLFRNQLVNHSTISITSFFLILASFEGFIHFLVVVSDHLIFRSILCRRHPRVLRKPGEFAAVGSRKQPTFRLVFLFFRMVSAD
jgi:hypothetical protein